MFSKTFASLGPKSSSAGARECRDDTGGAMRGGWATRAVFDTSSVIRFSFCRAVAELKSSRVIFTYSVEKKKTRIQHSGQRRECKKVTKIHRVSTPKEDNVQGSVMGYAKVVIGF